MKEEDRTPCLPLASGKRKSERTRGFEERGDELVKLRGGTGTLVLVTAWLALGFFEAGVRTGGDMHGIKFNPAFMLNA